MFANKPWKAFALYGGMILLGIACGLLASSLASGGLNLSRQPLAVQAAEAVPAAVTAPGSPDATYICTPAYIGAFVTRVHVLCTVAASGGIDYFAAPTSDSKNANRVLSIMLTAKSLGKNLQIYYATNGDGSSYGCQTVDCRPITAIEMTN